MEQNTLDVLIGACGSLIAAAILYVLAHWIVPLFRAMMRDEPKLHGTKWVGRPTDSAPQDATMEIRQWGERISAVVKRQTKKGERTFVYSGRYRAGQIAMLWREKDAANYNLGTFTLHLEGDLKTLRGVTTYYSHTQGKVLCADRVYEKVTAAT